MSSQDLLSFDERVPFQPPPLTERISMNLRIRAMNLIVKAGPLRSTARRNSFDTIAPTQFLIYPSQPSLRHRVFFPSASSTDEKPPLFIDIHGGGFFQGDPSLDDNLNALIARQLGCIVIALDYSKAPAAKFPTARNELVAVISQILDAGNVSFDKNRVVIGGYSAGANLALSVVQSPKLQRKIHGVVSFYPMTEFLTNPLIRAANRPYQTREEIQDDELLTELTTIRYYYVPKGHDLRDPQLSVHYADRSTLPKYIMIIGAERDLFCHEAWLTARRYAGLEAEDIWDMERSEKYAFEQNGVKWIMVRDAIHGFTHFAGATAMVKDQRRQQVNRCNLEVGAWLKSGPFAAVRTKDKM